MRIAKEFSDLIVYCRSIPFNPDMCEYHQAFPELNQVKVSKFVVVMGAQFYQVLAISRSRALLILAEYPRKVFHLDFLVMF